MRTHYKIGTAEISAKDLKWLLQHIAEHGPSGYKGSAFVLGDKDSPVAERVRVLESDVVRYACAKMAELGSGYF